MTISTGGQTYEAVWLRARLKQSRKPDLFIAQLDVPWLVEPPTFYLDAAVVEAPALAAGEEGQGRVKAFLVARQPDAGTLSVLIPGEPVSYGPQLVVPQELAA